MNTTRSLMIILLLAGLSGSRLPAQDRAAHGISLAKYNQRQRLAEVGAFVATVFTVGCGTDLLARKLGDPAVEQNYVDMGITYGSHRTAHTSGSIVAASLYLASGYQLYKANRLRESLAFRHKAHNALFLSSVTGLVVSGVTGRLCTLAYERGDDAAARDYARIMEKTGWLAMTLGFADLMLFGRKDNATIIGIKIEL
ncbi:MAG: hypothetical protein JSU61_10425 [Fidelibacterota bacterium]|nr:MAG: hypothetical protein JSU61_10425 [Candidatus Neomarinimicrobiota bacterium]